MIDFKRTKTFTHIGNSIPDIKAKNVGGVRLYETPEGELYPSITTVLKVRSSDGINEWRDRVGEDVANYISRTSATRGTQVHHFCEHYLNNDDDNTIKSYAVGRFLSFCLFNQLKSALDNMVNNIYAQEVALWSDDLKIAGRVDCIADYDGKLSVIDFKTSKKERQEEWNESYYIQATAYAKMFEERTGRPIDQIVILCVTEDGTVQSFVKNTSDYVPLLNETLKMYKEQEDGRARV